MNDATNDYDDLDRAIFALELSEPPAGLRESILRSTIYAAVQPKVAMATREIVAMGIVLALCVWAAIYAVADRALGVALTNGASEIAHALGDTTTLAWLFAGGVVAVVTTAMQGRALRLPIRFQRP